MPRDISEWFDFFKGLADERIADERAERSERRNTPYTSERLIPRREREAQLAAQRELEPFATFRKLRRIAPNPAWINGYNYGYSPTSPTTFVKQSEFMHAFEDDCEAVAEFYTTTPSLQQMSDAQLRTYYTWRTQLRRGHTDPVAFPYALLYCYELINRIGTKDAEEGFTRLIEFWTDFRIHDERIDPLLRRWALDYYLANELNEPFAVYNTRFPLPYEDTSDAVDAMLTDGYLNDLNLLERSSSYKLTGGQFFRKGDPTRLTACALSALRAVDELFAAQKLVLRKLFIEHRTEPSGALFTDAIYNPAKDKRRRKIQLNRYESVTISTTGNRRDYYSLELYRPVIGFIFKMLDARMRVAFEFPRQLKHPEAAQMKNAFLRSEFADALVRIEPWKKQAYALLKRKLFVDTLDTAIGEFLAEEASAAKNRVDIDFSRLAQIRADHEHTAKKLESLDDAPPIAANTAHSATPAPIALTTPAPPLPADDMSALVEALDADARTILAALLRGAAHPGFKAALLIEHINEAALDALGDNLIDTSPEPPQVFEDYSDELSQILSQYF